MRFKENPIPKHGDLRVFTYFAFIPVKSICKYTNENMEVVKVKETRWLEKVSILQQYHYEVENDVNTCYKPNVTKYWVNLEFVDAV